jgi:hypothetical protein
MAMQVEKVKVEIGISEADGERKPLKITGMSLDEKTGELSVVVENADVVLDKKVGSFDVHPINGRTLNDVVYFETGLPSGHYELFAKKVS